MNENFRPMIKLRDLLETFGNVNRYAQDCSRGKAGTLKTGDISVYLVDGTRVTQIHQSKYKEYDDFYVIEQLLLINRGITTYGGGNLQIHIEHPTAWVSRLEK